MRAEEIHDLTWDPKGSSQQVLWDGEGGLPGFGVRVYASGAKSFVVWVRNAETGRKRLVTVGRVGHVGLEEARSEAARIIEAFKAGGDPRAGPPAITRDRTPRLTSSQVLRLLAAIDEESSAVIRVALRLYLLTDLSQSELLRAEWDHLDRSAGRLRVPAASSRDDRHVDLPDEAWTLIEALPRRAGNPFLFHGRRRGSHLSGLSRAWRRVLGRAEMEDMTLDQLRDALDSGGPGHRARASADTGAWPSASRVSAADTEATTAPVDGGSAPSMSPWQHWWHMPRQALGIEITGRRLRAFRPSRGRAPPVALEVEWGTPPPATSLAALRERFGSANVLSLAIGMGDVLVKRLELPPLSMEERRGIITMDPRRYFPVLQEDLVAGVRDDDLVIAAPRHKLEEWVEALSALGSVERIESTPSALVRHMQAAGISGTRLLLLPHPDREGITLARVRDDELVGVRRLSSGTDLGPVIQEMQPDPDSYVVHPWTPDIVRLLEHTRPEPAFAALPSAPGETELFAAAAGAYRGLAAGSELTLTWPELDRRRLRVARRRGGIHVAGLLLALTALAGALDARRGATLETLEASVAQAELAARPVEELASQASDIAEELTALASAVTHRTNPLDVLLELTRILPPDVYVSQLSKVEDTWELTGYSTDAAGLVPLLQGSPRLDGVHFRAATTRVRVAQGMLDRFTLVFRHVPTT